MEKNEITESLRLVVADCYGLISQTHLCHWNVRGTGFFALHQAFEEQYTELFTAVDEVAERIRALGALAPGGLQNLASLAGMDEIPEDSDAHTMVAHLAKCNEKLVTDLGAARDLASEKEDSETEDMLIARIQVHQKTIWMLKSFLDG
ncbi:MAG: Dps family protein [Verrucomicrobiota bacterium]